MLCIHNNFVLSRSILRSYRARRQRGPFPRVETLG